MVNKRGWVGVDSFHVLDAIPVYALAIHTKPRPFNALNVF